MEIDKIAIHVMPEKFRGTLRLHQADSKKTGLMILLAGISLMILFVGFFYYFFIYSKNNGDLQTHNNTSQVVAPVKIINKKPSEIDNNPVIVTENRTEDNMPTETADVGIATGTKENVPIVDDIREDLAGTTTVISEIAATSSPIATTTAEIVIITAVDTDGDGLYDSEEKIFGTKSDMRDTDEDGYDDGAEIKNGFNPAGTGKFEESINFSKYINSKYNYLFLYPLSLKIDSVGEGESLIINLEGTAHIQIVAQENTNNLNLEDWYKKQFATDQINAEQYLYTDKWDVIKTEEGLTYYMKDKNFPKILILNYSATPVNNNYPNVMDMIFNSLEVL
jgi:hypothetical protein